jgi:hypothetical protein
MNKFTLIAIILAAAACGGAPNTDVGAPAPTVATSATTVMSPPDPTPAPTVDAGTPHVSPDAGDPLEVVDASDGGSTIPDAGAPDVGTSVTPDADEPDSASPQDAGNDGCAGMWVRCGVYPQMCCF